MEDALYKSLLDQFAEQGYDISRFQRFPQRP